VVLSTGKFRYLINGFYVINNLHRITKLAAHRGTNINMKGKTANYNKGTMQMERKSYGNIRKE
jgi:hypothetical protein